MDVPASASRPGMSRPLPWGLPQVRVHGARIYIGNVLPVTPEGEFIEASDIRTQTDIAFQRLRDAMAEAGAGLADLVRINTYYVYDGPEEGATRYWEEMTSVRLKYFVNPGPVGTAVRVAGTAHNGMLIQLEAEALAPIRRSSRRRIMPADSWDWSVPVPLSQGWRQDDYLWVGGQVCCDRQGRAVSPGDLTAQTSTVLRYIRNVIRDGGATEDDLLHLKICYFHDGDAPAAALRLSEIRRLIQATLGTAVPVTTAFGVNLLYEGLLLEIDASAVIDSGRREDTAQASRRGRFVQADARAGAAAQAWSDESLRASCQRCLDDVAALGGQASDVCRMTVFVSARSWRAAHTQNAARIQREVLSLWAGLEAPAITVSVVEGLPDEAMCQVAALACLHDEA